MFLFIKKIEELHLMHTQIVRIYTQLIGMHLLGVIAKVSRT